MTKREKNIIWVAAAVGVIFILSQGLPAVRSLYAQRNVTIESVRSDIERETRLLENTELWQERRLETESRLNELGAQVFSGDSVPLISANIQRMVRDYANQIGVTITSTRLATPMQTDDWLLVEQELSFLTDNQTNLLTFLQRLETSTPWLGVSAFSVRRNRNQYAGNIKVVGFSRAPDVAATDKED